jgi:uncharacterized protein YrrD
MADPVSWKVVEPGWRVVDANGEEVGKVNEVVGDANADIFSGLVVQRGLIARKEIPSEVVGDIVEGQVALTVTKDQLDALEDAAP